MTEIAGYRVLRRLGGGPAAEVLLGFAEPGDGPAEQVALKVRQATDPAGIVEAIALDRGAGDHVVRLLDLQASEDDTCLVLERLPGIGLDELLVRRSVLTAGEVVTIAAPIAGAVDRLHRVGVAHGAISTTAIRFDGAGAPVLLGFGRAALLSPGAPEVVLESHPAVVADRIALARLTALLLASVRGGGAARLAAELGRDPAPRPAEVADRLFDLAPGEPVRWEADIEPLELGRAASRSPAVPVGSGSTDADPDGDGPRPVGWGAATLGRVVEAVLPLIPAELRARAVAITAPIGRALGRLPVRSRRVAVAGAAGVLVVLAGTALWPSGPAASTSSDALATPAPAPTSTADVPDDPVAAAELLLETRDRCLRERSMLCLDAVVQSGSAAAGLDRELLATVDAGGELPTTAVAEGEPVLVERLGDSALVELPPGSTPSSVLLFRTADGWRIRDYLSAAVPP